MPVFAVIAVCTYLFSISLIVPGQVRKQPVYRRLALLLAVVALITHAITLKLLIFRGAEGQNLTLLNLGSAVSLLMCIIMTVVAYKGKAWYLTPIVYSFAIINLILSAVMPGEFITHLEGSIPLFIHIGLALLSYATLLIAALYAFQVALIDYQLKNKTFKFRADMPPMMVIERKMFHITQVGVILLTLTLCTGFIYMDNIFDKENIHKSVLSVVAWFVYIILLWGHFHGGWRGKRVLFFHVAGAFILTMAFFGNRLMQQIMVSYP
ncbi:inner membrane protein YpjD [Providencia stuartii]|uniref:cytochrome C assembly family protein n=1 Tax=Providencia stuartii TaxID=588 RepID=UPI0018C70AB9|nr:inner membrane protein YpjD [Providencia stuartii]EMD1718969.1 inner membrane protein YpjD [Providencia stuartii]MBG5909674.1 inner membrane protein YpjD [Providencia stuartii]WAZ75768.1 inner membrane protein YpjD [Providencia stuartii]HAU5733892.1 inner membrane protein YpjD [Providencia stuartii]HAU5774971.1 inner membrane protein YpjD [Providencia stuartii]